MVEIIKLVQHTGLDKRSVVIKGLTYTGRRGISLSPDTNLPNYGDVINENSKIVLKIEKLNPKLGEKFGWEEISTSNIREDAYFFIRSKLNGLLLDISGANQNPGAIVSTYHPKLTNNDNQLWKAEDGIIRSKLNVLVLDISGGNPAVNTEIVSNPVGPRAPLNQQS